MSTDYLASLLLCLKSPKERQALYFVLIFVWPSEAAELAGLIRESGQGPDDFWFEYITRHFWNESILRRLDLSLEAWLKKQAKSETPDAILRTLIDRIISAGLACEVWNFSGFLILDTIGTYLDYPGLTRLNSGPTRGPVSHEDDTAIHNDYGSSTDHYEMSVFQNNECVMSYDEV